MIIAFYVLFALLVIFWVAGYIVQDERQKRIIKNLRRICLGLFIILILLMLFTVGDATSWWDDPYFVP